MLKILSGLYRLSTIRFLIVAKGPREHALSMTRTCSALRKLTPDRAKQTVVSLKSRAGEGGREGSSGNGEPLLSNQMASSVFFGENKNRCAPKKSGLRVVEKMSGGGAHTRALSSSWLSDLSPNPLAFCKFLEPCSSGHSGGLLVDDFHVHLSACSTYLN